VNREIRATYRLQLAPGFGFDEAASLTDYLVALGVTHVYCSPYLQAAPGSTHGYDVVDPHRVNEELGGEEGHARFCAAVRAHGLGQILDVVPNHMAIGTESNRWWWDVLENGPSSRYAAYFDIDWDPPEERFRNVILLPVLGDQYGQVLDAGALRLAREGERFVVRYRERVFPAAPRSLDTILAAAAQRAQSPTLAFIADAYGDLPAPTATDRTSVERRHRDKEVLRRLLLRLLAEEPAAAAAVAGIVAEVNADPARLHELLERQCYRLVFWRMAGRDLGYRRFFDIDTLIGLRVEDADVFADTHTRVLRWLADGTLDGIRIDHPDGLRDPEAYLRRLRDVAPQAWIVVEKILEPGESLPETWPADGTTGYDFLNVAGGLFVDPAGERGLTQAYAAFTGETPEWARLCRETKLLALRELLGSEVRRLAALLVELCERHPRHRDHTRSEAEEVLRETIACLPVYRTYVRTEVQPVREADARAIDASLARAKASRPDLPPDLFDFLGDVLRLRVRGRLETELAMRFQQTTGAAMAKGVEDTAFYRFHRLVCLNEVGGDPQRFGVPFEAFHRWCAETQARRPHTLLATSTHDTKRSEDVRARLALLSEIPGPWTEAVGRWRQRNERHRRGDLPDRHAEALLYQTLVGAWPIATERVVAYMEKAAREAKTHTSWTRQDPEYETALRGFVTGVLADREFVADLERFVAPLVEPGRVTALALVLLKLTAPGVADIYRGTELWDLSLVDPDNRRPVDWGLRRRLLAELEHATPEAVWRGIDTGLPKLWVIRQALRLRQRRPVAFGDEGRYEPLHARGSRAHHVVAFARGGAVATVVPRLVIGLAGEWSETTIALPPGAWRNELTGERAEGGNVRLSDLLARFPVALLSRQEGGP
jgi:(1->4)-alpha-D-glucan 1-alpha-D-glucosylmutase